MRGLFAFNGCVEHQMFIRKKLEEFKIRFVIETGTLHGWTTVFLTENVEFVYTIEIRDEPLQKAREFLSGRNAHIFCGNSVDILPEIFSRIPDNEKIFFYLDSHWGENWPLFDELKLIGKCIGSRAVIIIDDFKVPDKDYAYDSYNGVTNELKTIEPYLKEIYKDGYEFEYLDGPERFELKWDDAPLDETEKHLYEHWFRGITKTTTGKILIYAKH